MKGCYINDLRMRYIRYGYRFYGRMRSKIHRLKPGKEEGQLVVLNRQFVRRVGDVEVPKVSPKRPKEFVKRQLLTKEVLLNLDFGLEEGVFADSGNNKVKDLPTGRVKLTTQMAT